MPSEANARADHVEVGEAIAEKCRTVADMRDSALDPMIVQVREHRSKDVELMRSMPVCDSASDSEKWE